MRTFLLTWNPDDYKWLSLAENAENVQSGDVYETRWATGRRTDVSLGDRFLLMRLGIEPKGIVACGTINSLVFQDLHWNAQKRADGVMKNFVRANFQLLSEAPLISLRQLEDLHPSYKWTPQGGGNQVPDDIASDLFRRIFENLNISQSIPKTKEEYREGRANIRMAMAYDRNPMARSKAIEIHGLDCTVCGFNFEKIYGPIGKDFIEVHHLRPLSSIGEEYLVDPIHDLRPVCVNCHRMLHRGNEVLSIEELKKSIACMR